MDQEKERIKKPTTLQEQVDILKKRKLFVAHHLEQTNWPCSWRPPGAVLYDG